MIAWGLGGLFFLVGYSSSAAASSYHVPDDDREDPRRRLVVVRRWFRLCTCPGPKSPRSPHRARRQLSRLPAAEERPREIIERLSLPSIRDHTGQIIPHPDVRLVIDHFLAWQQANGVR